MAEFWLTFQKEPDEVKIRGPDLSSWLTEGETVETLTVTVQELQPVQVEEITWDEVPTTIDVVLNKASGSETHTYTVTSNYDRAYIYLVDDDQGVDVTSTILDGNPYMDSNSVHAVFKGGEAGKDYIITYEWTTSRHRKEKTHALMQVRSVIAP
jgi:hypothetical protein